ncbi:Nitronate monooxygenase OS=Streptomyces microflavus OX=1919 GN=G3I39_23675 PE=4 SV=1 [Streptomyces microflavus]
MSRELGIEHAIFGSTSFPTGADAISRAGGLGALGAGRHTKRRSWPATSTCWTSSPTGKPDGLDAVMPAKKVEGVTEADVEAMIPDGHRTFVQELHTRHGVPELARGRRSGWRITGWMEAVARNQADVAFDYPIKHLANDRRDPALR